MLQRTGVFPEKIPDEYKRQADDCEYHEQFRNESDDY
jgi:hypothetical protein